MSDLTVEKTNIPNIHNKTFKYTNLNILRCVEFGKARRATKILRPRPSFIRFFYITKKLLTKLTVTLINLINVTKRTTININHHQPTTFPSRAVGGCNNG